MALPQVPKALMPHPKAPSRKSVRKKTNRRPPLLPVLIVFLVFGIGIFSMPTILAVDLAIEGKDAPGTTFPVTVIPDEKTIVYDPNVEAFLARPPATGLSASVAFAEKAFTWLAIYISELPAYRMVAGTNTLFVTILPGHRQEEVASIIGAKLKWSAAERAAFVKASDARVPGLTEGQFVPGTYFLSVTEPEQVEALLHQRFEEDILSRYGTTTAERVPLKDALTVASLIQREAGGWDDMRLISGIIWNRLFAGMNLQIDATLQYAKANDPKTKSWWPPVVPDDKYIKSKYNTYQNRGLPPSPIANPSVAAVLAALNPKQTDCMFYFHDARGEFHCSPTYEGHVKLLKQYYGRGK